MTRPNITPGPWCYTKGVSPAVNSQQERHTLHIAKTIYGSHDEALANARAISAVPALLNALETIHANAAESPEWIRRHTIAALTAAGYQF